MSLAASRRVTRPEPEQLDPYLDQEYLQAQTVGNPHLRPEYTQSYELGYGITSHGTALQLTGYYRRNDDTAVGVTQYLGNGESLRSQESLPRADF